ncbi:MAG TPA: T9SS type B sorting domain-containing protein [Bacteroidetes bacterium]|nr:T9SS type B sorting domain-containing protein [Bacteroidota bacterium]
MRKTKTLIIFCLFPFFCFAQNLMRNGNFENDSCRIWQGRIDGWFQVNSADYLHMSCQGVANSTYKKPYDGRGCIGLYNGGFSVSPTNDTFPSREYIIGELTEPLIKGEKYNISFWVKPSSVFDAPSENMTTDSISLAFIQDTSELRLNTIPPWVIHLKPAISNNNGILMDIDNYTKIEGCYMADGTEKLVVLGNFSLFPDVSLVPLSANTIYNYSYLLIDKIEIRKLELPLITDTLLCKEEEITINASNIEGHEYFIDGQEIIDSIILFNEGTYNITATLGECIANNIFEIKKEECTNCSFYIPNVFSPDENGINDHTMIASNCQFDIIESSIYDRWGNMVYEAKNNFSWDGKFRGEKLNSGTYVYLVKIKLNNSLDNSIKIISGDISILE